MWTGGHSYFSILSQTYGVPLALSAAGAETLLGAIPGMKAAALGPVQRAPVRGYEVVQGVAIVPVQGVLVRQASWLTDAFGMTGYDTIGATMQAAIADPDVRAIMMQVNSPGGPCSGCFELADAIYAMRGAKPIMALVADTACSAAYALASAADDVVGSATCIVGSIGIIALYEDVSRQLADQGVAVNLLSYGAAKTDGNPYQPMTKAAAARLQGKVNVIGQFFVATVARNRGLTPAAVKGTEAAQFMGEAAVKAGLLTGVMSRDAAFRALLGKVGQVTGPAAARTPAPRSARPPARPAPPRAARRALAPPPAAVAPPVPASAGWAEAFHRNSRRS